jgi:alpha-tubulin suppressor-like RCC1 family protein
MRLRVLLLALLLFAGTAVASSPQASANPLPSFSAVSAGLDHTCALTTTGGVKCWGWNNYGQLGNGTTTDSSTPVDVTGLTSGVVAISAGSHDACALTMGGGVKCWGRNEYGQLGNSTTIGSGTPADVTGLTSGAANVSVGSTHACALTTGGGVKCWGRNSNGQLGSGTTTDSSTPVDVTGLTSGGAALSAGVGHTCALTTGGGVKCWGSNFEGELGNGTTTNSSTAVNVTGLASGVAAISAGAAHACALTTSGGVECWGWNHAGQLGNGTSGGPDCFGYCNTTAVDVTGLASGVAAISAGAEHTCALTTGGGVKCWGDNSLGELGNGTDTGPETCSYFGSSFTCSSSPLAVAGLASGIGAVGPGQGHTCAVLMPGGGVKCWGSNGKGQLGNGTANTGSTVPYDVSGKPAPDSDGDGCTDPDEQQNGTGSELTGGKRDLLNQWDYFNPSHDGQNRIDDVLLVVDAYFIDAGNPAYNADTDRTLVGPLAWNLGPPNGLQRIDDVVNIVKQYFHDCS